MSEKVTLYKYVSSLEYLIGYLEHERLYLSDGTNFNDPFEIKVTDKAKKTVRHIEELHILSLTNSYRKKLMWSHYAQSHKGVCLTIEVPKDKVYPICYTTKRIYEDSDIDAIISDSIKKAKIKQNVNKDFSSLSKNKKISFIKDKKWNYEKEYRMVFDKDDESELISDNTDNTNNKDWYLKVKITNIYLGVNFDKNEPDLQNKILELCERKKIKITQMVLSDSDYSLKVKQ